MDGAAGCGEPCPAPVTRPARVPRGPRRAARVSGVRCSPPPTPAPSTGRRPRAPARSWRTAPAPPAACAPAPRSRACPDARRGRSRIARTTPTARRAAGGGASRIEDIEAGLENLVTVIRQRDIHSIAMPPLGSGLGGLDWNAVRACIENRLQGFNDLDVVVFEPRGHQRSAAWSAARLFRL